MKVNRPLGILYRFYLHLKEKFDPRPQITDEERYAVNISKKLIKTANTHLYIAPLSNKKYIKNDDKHMFIVIETRNITLINHVYSYSVFIENDQLFDDLIGVFNETMEEKRLVLENEIKSNIQHSLKNILENLTDPI
jgi:hypothetical protein